MDPRKLGSFSTAATSVFWSARLCSISRSSSLHASSENPRSIRFTTTKTLDIVDSSGLSSTALALGAIIGAWCFARAGRRSRCVVRRRLGRGTRDPRRRGVLFSLVRDARLSASGISAHDWDQNIVSWNRIVVLLSHLNGLREAA
jgi:hypothetical protein